LESKQPQDAPSADAGRNMSQFLTPSGRELVVSAIRGTALYCINYGDGRGGSLPDKYTGRYTKPDLAANDLKQCLKEMCEAAVLAQTWSAPQQLEVMRIELPTPEKTKRRGRPPKSVVETTQLQV
jgi:hypothetical protein